MWLARRIPFRCRKARILLRLRLFMIRKKEWYDTALFHGVPGAGFRWWLMSRWVIGGSGTCRLCVEFHWQVVVIRFDVRCRKAIGFAENAMLMAFLFRDACQYVMIWFLLSSNDSIFSGTCRIWEKGRGMKIADRRQTWIRGKQALFFQRRRFSPKRRRKCLRNEIPIERTAVRNVYLCNITHDYRIQFAIQMLNITNVNKSFLYINAK